MASATLVAEYLIHLKNIDKEFGEDYPLTNLKLQKLLYYCQGAHYVWDQEQLITDNIFEAWEYGPVLRTIYHEYKRFGQNDITLNTFAQSDRFDKLLLNEQETIQAVWNQLKNFSAFELVEQTHNEKPWQESARNNKLFIEESNIRDYFINDAEGIT